MADQTTRNNDNISGASSSSMASCSCSTSYNSYDVFINHRGPDVKATLATDLYRSLNARGLRVFLDNPELEVGQNITPQILHAIETAFIHIAIFSSTYAESKWCLEELLHMLKAFQSRPNEVTIIPVFYGVEPWEVRWTNKGAYAEALSNHEKKQRFEPETIQNWRRALSEAAEISGFDSKAYNGNVGRLLDAVLRCVSKICDRTPLKYVAEHPTALKEKLEDFESTVLWPGKAKVVGIVGTGGVGKTTLATEFFSKRRSNYNRSCFLYDVRETAAKGSLTSLQRKLLKELTGLDLPIDSIKEGTSTLVSHLSSSHILIILDDVDEALQLEAFLPLKEIMKPNSLILVTSRDKKVLKKAKIEETSIYMLEGLNRKHSEELFCFHAFGQPHPQQKFADLVYQFITACDGLPLSLKVFGALLFGENERSYWLEILNRLHELPPEIQERLRISYDSLNSKERQVFLNISCFFVGENRDTAARIWGFMELLNIENKCLLKVNSENFIEMHDHIRDLGRSIAEEEEIMPRGLWRHTTNTIEDLLERSSRVITKVRGIKTLTQANPISQTMMESSEIESEVCGMDSSEWYSDEALGMESSEMSWCKRWSDEIFGNCLRDLFNDFRFRVITKVRGIKTLTQANPISQTVMESSEIESEVCGMDSSEWYSDEALGMESSEMSWCKRWSDEIFGNCLRDLFNNLRFRGILNLQLVATEEDYPERILRRARSAHLMWLRWFKCGNSCLPSWIPMESLRVLEVAGAKLKLLWQHESQAPLQLRELKIWAPSFSNFPRSIGQLKQLEKITIFQALIKTVPEEFCDLRSLKYLELIKCSKMMSLPDSFGNLTNLQHLDFSGALSLQMLPKSFGNLTRLEHLGLRDCRSLTFSNETFGNIITLEHINISGCSSVKELPPQLAHQRSLQTLNVCKTNLKELPSGIGDVCKSEVLELGGELLLEILPTLLGCLKSLKELWLFNCPELKCLPDDFGRLTQLMELKIWNCGIEYLPQELMGIKNLEILIIEDCPLQELPFKKAEGELDFSDGKCMLKLKLLKLAGTQISELFFDGGVCPNLQYLSLERCSELRGIEGICRLAKLQYLYVSPRLKVEALAGVEQHMKSCKESDLINEFVELEALQRLGHFTDAMIYVNKCPEILETGSLKYLRRPSADWVRNT